MSKFIEIPTVLEYTSQQVYGGKAERMPSLTRIDIFEICAYTQSIPDDSDKDAIIVYLSGGHQFYSTMSMKEFETILKRYHIE